MAKITTTKAPSATKCAAKSVAAPKTTGISVTGNKKIETLSKEFTKAFPYLLLRVYYHCTKEKTAAGEAIPASYMIEPSRTLGNARSANTSGGMTITGRMKISSVEKEFQSVFGLHCQVCYWDASGNVLYTSGAQDAKTISAFNAECEKNGCRKIK